MRSALGLILISYQYNNGAILNHWIQIVDNHLNGIENGVSVYLLALENDLVQSLL